MGTAGRYSFEGGVGVGISFIGVFVEIDGGELEIVVDGTVVVLLVVVRVVVVRVVVVLK